MTEIHDSLMYDIDLSATTEELYSNPATRWFASKQAAKLIARGIVAAGDWNPLLHPRGRDGKFINKFGFIRWFDVVTGKWRRAMVKSIDGNGTLHAVTTDTKESVAFPHEAIAKKVYSAPVVKATLDLPEVFGKTDGWTKTGGQGGSNPGGFFQLEEGHVHMSTADWLAIAKEHSLHLTAPDTNSSTPQIMWNEGSSPYIWADLGDGLGWYNVAGKKLDEVPEGMVSVSSISDEETIEAWSKVTEFYATFAKGGSQFYVKKGATDKHVANEVLANRLYELAGVPVAEVVTDASKTTIASKLVPFTDEKKKLGDGLMDQVAMDRLKEDFVVDAWLANWDVVGLSLENVQIVDGVPYRIDAGGAISYRAQGAPKGKAFGPIVGELDSLLDPKINPKSAKAFQGITHEQMMLGAMKVASVDPDAIDTLVATLGLEPDVADTLKARRQYIIDKFDLKDPWHTDPYVDVDNLPKPTTHEPVGIDDAPEDIAPVSAPPTTSKVSLNGKIYDYASGAWVDGEFTKPSSYFIEKINEAVGEAYFPSSNSNVDMNNENLVGSLVVYEGSLHSIESVADDGTVVLNDVVFNTKSLAALNNDSSPSHLPLIAWADSDDKQTLIDTALSWASAYVTELASDPAKLHSLIMETASDSLDVAQEHQVGVMNPTPKFLSVKTNQFFSESKPSNLHTVAGPKDFLGKPGDLIYSLVDNSVYSVGYQEEVDINTKGTLYVKKNPSDVSPKELLVGGDDLGSYVVLPTGPFATAILDAVYKTESQVDDVDLDVTVVPEKTAAMIDKLIDKDKAIVEVESSVEPTVNAAKAKELDLTHFLVSINSAELSNETKEKIKNEFAYVEGSEFTSEGFLKWASENLTPEETDLIVEQYNYEGSISTLQDYPYITKEVPGKTHSFLHPDLPFSKTIDLNQASGVDDFDGLIERLIGKVVVITPSDGVSEEVGYGTKAQGIVHVKEYKNGKLVTVTASGQILAIPFDVSAEHNKYSLHVLGGDMVAEKLISSPKPVMKKTGEIAYGGVVVGTWSSESKFYGYNTYTYKYELLPEFTVTGTKISGSTYKKKNLAGLVQLGLLPKPASVAKKSSASTVTKTIKQYVNKSIPGEPKLYNGETAELGTWVASTKGGGGFVGKIVGWPNQDTHPGLAIVVGKDGVQKIVNLKTQKSVPEPPDLDGDGVPIVSDIPNAYAKEEFKLADGKFPVIGQRVKAGKPGSEIEGIITNVNPTQGWVYILQDNGKKTSKTFSVTTVLEEPHLIWDPDIPIEVKVEVAKPSPPKKPKKPKAPTYVPADGSLYEQAQSVKDEWVAKGLALTKDGYVPETAMHVVLKDGSFGIVIAVPNPYSGKPNSMGVYNVDKGKMSYVSPANVEVNHIKQLAGHLGQPVKKIAKITNLGPHFTYSNYDGVTTFPKGTKLYTYYTKSKQVYQGEYRNVVQQYFFALTPDGTMHKLHVHSDGVNSGMTGDPEYHLKGMLKYHSVIPGEFSLVGVFDPDGENVHINPPKAAPVKALKSPLVWDAPDVPPPPQDLKLEEASPITLTLDASKAAPAFSAPPSDAPNVQTDVVDAPSDAYVGLGDLTADDEGLVIVDPTKVDIDALPSTVDAVAPALIPQSSLSTPLPTPTPQKPANVAAAFPPPPSATGATADLASQNPVLVGTKTHTIAEAAAKMLAIKDSTAPGTGSVFATGDSDLVDDMEFRFNVMKEGQHERLRLRFRLRENNAEDFVSTILGATGGLLGSWKAQDSKYPVDFKPGDAIAVRIGAFTAKGNGVKQLKPDLSASKPNARVISHPKPIGKSPGPNGEGMYLTYRVQVQTADGSIGELDLQMRPSATLMSFEWDPDAPDFTSNSKLSLLPTASEMGWVDVGPAFVEGYKGSVQVDEAGKWTPSGTINVIQGDKGRKLRKALPNGVTINVNGVHPTVSGIGNKTARRSNFAGEVTIDVPLDGRDEQEILKNFSEALEFVGIPPEKQSAPSNEKLVELALGKLVSQYHPKYVYRGAPITGPEDKRVVETLEHMSNVLKETLGRPVTLDDVRIHTSDDGTMRFMLSPEVGIAIAKNQKAKHHVHGGAASYAVEIFAGTHSGLLATETRWSLGITTTGQSSHADILNGSGDRVYTRGRDSAPAPGNFSINAAVMAMSMETYTNIASAGGVAFDASGDNNPGYASDAWGRRGGLNKFIEHVLGAEAMTKRKIDPDMISFYITNNEHERESIIKKLKSRGVTKIGNRSVEEIVVTYPKAKELSESDDWYMTGMDVFENDIPITTLITGAPSTPAPEGAI